MSHQQLGAESSLYICSACKKPIPFAVNFCPSCGYQQNSGTAPLWLGERRLVTVLFADLASFTAASEDADPEDVIEMLNHVFSRLMKECDREGGYLDKTVGDQLMVLFGAPRAHEDDAVRAVQAALNMQKAMEELGSVMLEKVGTACKLNIGINTGAVVWGRVGPPGRAAATVIGDAINLASRLQSFAKNGQIAVSDAVYFQTRRFFEYEILDPIQVKGKRKPVPVYVPLGPHQSVRTRQQATEIKTPLSERDQEMEALDVHWSRALAGQPQSVMIQGEAGMGKTRLLSQFVDELSTYAVDKQPLVLQVHSEAASIGNYSPLVGLLSQLFNLTANDTELGRRRKVEDRAKILGITSHNFLPLIGYLLGWYRDDNRLARTAQELDYLRESAIDAAIGLFFRQSTRRPVLLIVDDLQWANTTTSDWFKRLAAIKRATESKSANYQLMVVIASRPQLETGPPPADSIIQLNPLSEMARRDLIKQLLSGRDLPPSIVDRLSRESGGNPFYIEEATRGLVQSKQLVRQAGAWKLTRPVDQIYIPHSVEGLITAHLDALDPVNRMVLQYASVIGLQFGFGLLSAITPVDNIEAALTNLERRGLIQTISEDSITGERRTFSFTQVVVREVAYRSLLRKTRRELHEQIARLTEVETPTEEDDVETLAHHYTAGGNSEKSISYNWLAGRRALDSNDYEEAYQHLTLAWNELSSSPDPDPETYRNLAHALGDASTFTGNYARAVDCYSVIQEIDGNNPEEIVTLQYKIARVYFYQDNVEAAIEGYQHALELAANNPRLSAQIEAELRLLNDAV
ncbi:MAG: AAA family ATPase [Anaerolineae bacterium]|nr:AAA family ATPase [Anaerolineae bacterium]